MRQLYAEVEGGFKSQEPKSGSTAAKDRQEVDGQIDFLRPWMAADCHAREARDHVKHGEKQNEGQCQRLDASN